MIAPAISHELFLGSMKKNDRALLLSNSGAF
jgi:hypothetical protein